jgi:N,N-dimethylformamidase
MKPNRTLDIGGVVQAYAEKSVTAGQADPMHFRVHSKHKYKLSVVRLGWDVLAPRRDWVLKTFDQNGSPLPKVTQTIRPGSYIHIADGQRIGGQANDPSSLPELTLEAWVRPFGDADFPANTTQGVITQYAYPNQCGFGLFIGADGRAYYYFGDGGTFHQEWLRAGTSPLTKHVWHHLVATFYHGQGNLWVDGVYDGNAHYDYNVANASNPNLPVFSQVNPGLSHLRLGAFEENGLIDHFLEGDLAMPVVYQGIGPFNQYDTYIKGRYNQTPPVAPNLITVMGCWPLTEETGTTISDVGASGLRTGTVINHATWMIGGPGFDALAVPRHGPYDPTLFFTAAARGHAIRFASDDLYDCQWSVQHTWPVPANCKPGIYAARIDLFDDYDAPLPNSLPYYNTFVVQRAAGKPPAPVLAICATNTWQLYDRGFGSMGDIKKNTDPNDPNPKDPYYGKYNQMIESASESLNFAWAPDFLGYTVYGPHKAGQPTYYVGRERPWPQADPYGLRDAVTGYAHLVNAERRTHVWLEKHGIDYDVVSDDYLAAHPDVLLDYRTVMIVGHSEYWSADSWAAVKKYLAQGRNLIAVSGNTAYWRVTHNGDGVIECRKYAGISNNFEGNPELNTGGDPYSGWGELYHEHDKKRGGLMREAESSRADAPGPFPAWQLTGLECVGYDGTSSAYTVTDTGASHKYFTTPEPTNLAAKHMIGGDNCVGHEYDVRATRIHDLRVGPSAYYTPPDGYNPTLLAYAPYTDNTYFDYETNRVIPAAADDVYSEMVYWESAGGRVFAAGTIGFGLGLDTDPHLEQVFRNVLHDHGVVYRLEAAAIGTDGSFYSRSYDGTNWGSWGVVLPAKLPNGQPDHFSYPPIGLQWAPDSYAVMAISANGNFKYKYGSSGHWYDDWQDFGGGFTGRPAAAGWGRNQLDLFAVKLVDGHVYRRSYRGNPTPQWHNWTVDDNSKTVTSDVAAASWEGTGVGVVALGTSNNLLYFYYRDGQYQGCNDFGSQGGGFIGRPAINVWGGNKMNLYARGNDGHLWTKHWDGRSWWDWKDLGGTVASSPTVASWGRDQFTVLAQSGFSMVSKWFDGANWKPSDTGWEPRGWQDITHMVGQPAAVSFRGGQVAVMARSTDGGIKTLIFDGGNWKWYDSGFPATVASDPMLFRWIGPKP